MSILNCPAKNYGLAGQANQFQNCTNKDRKLTEEDIIAQNAMDMCCRPVPPENAIDTCCRPKSAQKTILVVSYSLLNRIKSAYLQIIRRVL